MEKKVFQHRLNEKVIAEISDNYNSDTGCFYSTKKKVRGTIINVIHNGCYLNTRLLLDNNKTIWVNFYKHIFKPNL